MLPASLGGSSVVSLSLAPRACPSYLPHTRAASWVEPRVLPLGHPALSQEGLLSNTSGIQEAPTL